MIFVCVGSRNYQFDRLLKKMDELVAAGRLPDEVFAQIGQSNYEPENYKYERYVDTERFHKLQHEASVIISHGGTGALISALKMGKQLVAVPRLKKYGEHIDDHQLQVCEAMEEEGYLRCARDMDELEEKIILAFKEPIQKKYARPSRIVETIEEYIEANRK